MIFRNAVILKPDASILAGYDFEVLEGRFTRIGKELIDDVSEGEVDLSGKLVFPGLINAHTHLGETVFRGFCDGMNLHEYINKSHSTFEVPENKAKNEEIHSASSRMTLLELIQNGTTAICASRGWEDVRNAGIRGFCGLPLIKIGKTEKYYDAFFSGGFDYRSVDDVITPIIYVQSIMTLDHAELTRLAAYLRETGHLFYIHISETSEENEWCQNQYHMSPVKYLESLGMLGDNAILVHCLHLTDEDIKLIEAYRCHVVLCPVSNMKLGSGIPGVERLLDTQINISLGTDGLATNNSADLFETAKQLLLLAPGRKDFINRVLRMLTLNAAEMFNMQDKLGNIKEGFYADFTVYDCNSYFLKDIETLISNFLFNHRMFRVDVVFCNGKNIAFDRETVRLIGENFFQVREEMRLKAKEHDENQAGREFP